MLDKENHFSPLPTSSSTPQEHYNITDFLQSNTCASAIGLWEVKQLGTIALLVVLSGIAPSPKSELHDFLKEPLKIEKNIAEEAGTQCNSWVIPQQVTWKDSN